jgi:hypothetical protein
VNCANFLFLNIINHLSKLLIGATFTRQVGLRPTPEHVPALAAHFLNNFDAWVYCENFHLLIHLTLRTAVLDLLLILFLVDGGVWPLHVGFVEGNVMLDRPILQTAELFLQSYVDMGGGHSTVAANYRYAGN